MLLCWVVIDGPRIVHYQYKESSLPFLLQLSLDHQPGQYECINESLELGSLEVPNHFHRE